MVKEDTNPAQASMKTGLRERQRELRNKSILSAASDLLADKGYEAMTMEDLAERAAISKPTLCQHFASKEMVVAHAMVALTERSVAHIREMSSYEPAIDRLEQVVRWLIHERLSPTHGAFFQAKSALMPVIKSHPDFQHACAQIGVEITELIETAQAQGDIVADLSAGLLVHGLFRLLIGDEYPEQIRAGKTSADEIVEMVMRIFFHGIRPSGAQRSDRRNA